MIKYWKNLIAKQSVSKTLWLVAIFALALFGRVWGLNKIPAGLQVDEGLVTYQAYTIAETGLSQFNNQAPVHFTGFGWGENSLLIYLLVPLIKLFGLGHVWLLRLIIVFSHLLILGLLYLLTKELFTDKIALLAIFLLSISPWDLTLSRLLFNVSLLPIFLLAGLYLLLRGLKTKKTYFFIGAAICYSLSLYCYALAFLWLPLMLCLIVFVYREKVKQIRLNSLLAFIAPLVLLGLPITIFYLKNQFGFFSGLTHLGWLAWPDLSQTRWDHVSIFSGSGWLLPVLLVKNYVLHLAPTFLFGSANSFIFPKFLGLLYLWQAPLFFAGLLVLIKDKAQANYKFVLLWLLLAAIPSSLTRENIPHPLRFINALGLLEIICAVGLSYIYALWQSWKNKKIYLIAGLLVIALNIGGFYYNFFVVYPQTSWRHFQGADQQITQFINQQKTQFEQIKILAPRYVPVLALEPYNYLLYSQLLPENLNQVNQQIINHEFSYQQVSWEANDFTYYGEKKDSWLWSGVIMKARYQPTEAANNTLYIVPLAEEFNSQEFLADKNVLQEFKDQTGKAWFVAVTGQ